MSALHPPEEDGGAMAANGKRHRRPSVRLGDIGGNHSSFYQHQRRPNKASKNHRQFTNLRRFTNFSSNQTITLVDTTTSPNHDRTNNWSNNVEDEDNNRDVNLDNVAIGSWKIRALKSKKGPITKKLRSNWASKANDTEKNDKVVSTDIEDLENNENSGHSPVRSYDNNNEINDNVNGRKRVARVSEEGPTDTEGRDWNCGLERNGVRVWLNQLGLGRYAPVFEIHEVDDEVLPMLTLEDLKDMGINAVGSRRKMYCSIQKLNKGFS